MPVLGLVLVPEMVLGQVLVPERVLTGTWPSTFRLALLEKDVAIAVRFLEEQGVTSPVLHLTGQLFRAARKRLGEQADYLEGIRMQERDAGVQIRSKEEPR